MKLQEAQEDSHRDERGEGDRYPLEHLGAMHPISSAASPAAIRSRG